MYSKKIVIRYTPEIVQQPIIYLLAKKHNLVFNILKARIFPRREGVIVLELSGQKEDFDRGIRFLKEMGLKVEPLPKACFRLSINVSTAAHAQDFAQPAPYVLKNRHKKSCLILKSATAVNFASPPAQSARWKSI